MHKGSFGFSGSETEPLKALGQGLTCLFKGALLLLCCKQTIGEQGQKSDSYYNNNPGKNLWVSQTQVVAVEITSSSSGSGYIVYAFVTGIEKGNWFLYSDSIQQPL